MAYLGRMEVLEGVFPSCRDHLRPIDRLVGIAKPGVELIVLEAPAPVVVRQPIHFPEHFTCDQQDATDESGVVVFRMEAYRKKTTIFSMISHNVETIV